MHRAELYASNARLSARDAKQILPEYFHTMSWKSGERVLDLGCGPGSVTTQVLMPLLPADFDLLVGLDVSPQMIQYATKTYTHPKLRFVECDLSKDIGNISALWPPHFDKIFSIHCLHWIQDQRKAVRNIYSLLRNGGEILLVLAGRCHLYRVYEILSRKPEWQLYMKDVRQFISPYHHSSDPAQEFNKLLQDTGFEVIDCECRGIEYNFDTFRHYKDFMTSVNPFIDRMPTELHEQYFTDFATEMGKQSLEQTHKNTEDGSIPNRYEIIVAYAKKT